MTSRFCTIAFAASLLIALPLWGQQAAPPKAKPMPAAPMPAAAPMAAPKPKAFPEVVLSAEHAKNCVVKVGDAFPNLSLDDDAGKPQTLQALRGQAQITLVVFFTTANPVGTDAFKMLQQEVVTKYGGKVAVIAVHLDKPAAALPAVPGRAFPVLIDAQRTGLAQVAKDTRLPRFYLLDGAGKIAWFDIEWAEETRRQLHAGIRFALGL